MQAHRLKPNIVSINKKNTMIYLIAKETKYYKSLKMRANSEHTQPARTEGVYILFSWQSSKYMQTVNVNNLLGRMYCPTFLWKETMGLAAASSKIRGARWLMNLPTLKTMLSLASMTTKVHAERVIIWHNC